MLQEWDKWEAEPVRVAAIVVEHFPYEAEQIVLDFLEGAADAANPSTTLFWTVVFDHVEQMQMKLADDPSYAPELRFTAVM
jgi:hypothetical protein